MGLAVLVILTAGCQPEEPVAPPRFSVRLLTSPNVSGRWEAAGERGLGLIAAELGADVARRRVGDGPQGQGQLVAEGGKGVDLVFCIGGGFEQALYAEAGAYPETVFVLLPGRAHAANMAGIEFLPEGAGYLAGVVAATIASAPRAGLLRGVGGPWLEALERGFGAGFGAHHRRAVVETEHGVEGVWALNVTDVNVALYASDGPEPGVMEAAREAGLRLIVTDPRLMTDFPDTVVAAVDIDVAEAMLRVAREVRDGTFVGQVYSFDLGSGILDVTVNSELDPALLEAATVAMEEARAEVTAGLIEVDRLGL
jgi:basic membrane lipoprotein Med (substrate-binding protein (PBP1-ABC) superfamily)